MAAVGLPLAVVIKQKWRRRLITSELNFNILSISSTFSSKDLIQQVLECGVHFFMDFANRHEPFFKVPSDVFSSKDLIQQVLECGVHFFMDFANGFEPFFKVPSDAFSPKDLIQQVLECGVHFFMDFANGFEPFFKLLPLSRDFESCNPPYQLRELQISRHFLSKTNGHRDMGLLSEFEGHANLNRPFYVHVQLFLKPMVHRVTTINGIEQSRQKSNLYRRKSAEAGSRFLRKNYSTTNLGPFLRQPRLRFHVQEKRLRLESTLKPRDYLHCRYNLR
ncbi:hypothetical protein T02_1190 [Trichinella nativa]|uniref:Uncharacterized protein n=1 Tax=Trichinella nativa TaxID=6335 RepID=A0A0V1LMI0_9BILA|nr:hypothetical protein T02_1190 [Trichinella nativa]